MAAVVSALSTRIKYLQSLRQHTSEEDMRRTAMGTECNVNQFIDKYPYTLSLDTATTLIEIISEDTTLFSEEFRQCMIEKLMGSWARTRSATTLLQSCRLGQCMGSKRCCTRRTTLLRVSGVVYLMAKRGNRTYICPSWQSSCGWGSFVRRRHSGAHWWPHCNGVAAIPISMRLT